MAQLIFFSLGQMRQLLRTVGGVIVTGVAGGVAWRIAMRIIFGSAQRVLTNPSLQSSKMLNAFLLSPVPRTSHQPEPALDRLVIYWNPVGALVYRAVSIFWKLSWWRKGLLFWATSWVRPFDGCNLGNSWRTSQFSAEDSGPYNSGADRWRLQLRHRHGGRYRFLLRMRKLKMLALIGRS